MAGHIEDRWHDKRTGERTARYGQGKRWLLRWRDPDGTDRKLSFARKTDADDQRKSIEGDLQRGAYIDPKAGTQTFDDYATFLNAHTTTDLNTQEREALTFHNHVKGTPLGKTSLSAIRPSTVQAWISSLTSLQSSTAKTTFNYVRKALEAATDDGLIAWNPCKASSVTPPRPEARKMDVWSAEQVKAMRDAIDARYRPILDLGAGLGLRPGEIYALGIHDIDWFRGSVMLRRQVKIVRSPVTNKKSWVFALPKGAKERHMPVSRELLLDLSEYLERFPAQEVTLPWKTPEGPPETVSVVMSNYRNGAANPATAIRRIWYPALKRAGIPNVRENGQHALRHFYVSSALAGGENPVSVAQWTGHASTGYMLQVYGHPMEHTEQQSRDRVDALFRSFKRSA